LFFNYSTDGTNFKSILKSGGPVYFGGISELGFAVTTNGIYAVGRNEDGDKSGSGTRIFYVSAQSNYQDWTKIFPSPLKSDPNIYESPRMFTWGDRVFLVARRDLNPPFDRAPKYLPFVVRKYFNLATYSLRAHTTAIWMLVIRLFLL
jgi:hypothetical protein